jgi:hypothetical protein
MAEKKYWYRSKARGFRVKIVPANLVGLIIAVLNSAIILVGFLSAAGVSDILPDYPGALLALTGLGFLIYSLIFKTDYSPEG